MKRTCTGPLEFTPHRPWTAERKAAASIRARAEYIARAALMAKPVHKKKRNWAFDETPKDAPAPAQVATPAALRIEPNDLKIGDIYLCRTERGFRHHFYRQVSGIQRRKNGDVVMVMYLSGESVDDMKLQRAWHGAIWFADRAEKLIHRRPG